jgi:hypothetical protein
MEQLLNTYDLSAEQQNTAALLERLLGRAIANRYVDFCRLAAGAFALHVSRPVAAHALRELESMLRGTLAVPMEATDSEETPDQERLEKARNRLAELGFDAEAINQALNKLKPRLSHKAQIRKIVGRLGLAPDGDIANSWVSLSDSFGRAHERSFHHSLSVDDEFRIQYREPFESVIRAIAVALQSRYSALMRRVEELAAMSDKGHAVSLFEKEIPGALPLQWHFFKTLQTPDWLPHLARENLLGEPISGSHEGEGSRLFRQWPAGDYLLRMAQSSDAPTRKLVVEAIRNIAFSRHADVQHHGIDIIAALPPEESAPLSDIVVAWLDRDTRFFLQAPQKLVKNLAEGGQEPAALIVARALLQLSDQNGQIASLYDRHMYEHHLPALVKVLTKACGEDALRLFSDLLQQAGIISGKNDYSHFSSRSVADWLAGGPCCCWYEYHLIPRPTP